MSKWIKKLTEAYAEVNEKKTMDPVDHSALKGSHKDRKDKDIDNDGDVDKSDEYLHNRRKAVKKAMAKEAADLNKDNAEKAIRHDCATHVEHAEWGKGQPISGQHTIVETSEGEGYVTHYDVMFEHGIEKDVSVDDLTILAEMSHGHSRKKKMKEGDVEMNPKKKEDKKAMADTMEDTLPPVYARIMENREREKHMKGATPPEGMHDKSKSSKGAMDMLNTPKEIKDNPEADGVDMKKASSAGPSAAKRRGDNPQRDAMQAPKDTTKAA